MPSIDQVLDIVHNVRLQTDKVDDFLQQFHGTPELKAKLGAIDFGKIFSFIQMVLPVIQQFFKAPELV